MYYFIVQYFVASSRIRVCTKILESPKFRIISEVFEADDFAKFLSIFFQNFTVDSAEVLNNSRTVPLKMCNFADFHR